MACKPPPKPLPKNKPKKKNGVHTSRKTLSKIPTHIWACVDVKNPTMTSYSNVYHEWNMRYWGLQKSAEVKKNQSLQKKRFEIMTPFSFIIWKPKNSTIWSHRMKATECILKITTIPLFAFCLQAGFCINTLSLKTLSDFIESKRQW